MKSFRKSLILTLTAVICFVGYAQTPDKATEGNSPSKPFSIDRFQSSIDAFLAADRKSPPPEGGILFIGSSIFRQWTTVTNQMAPLPVFNRAFGGSRTAEVLHYTPSIVIPYKPRIIVYYCGSNDINANIGPDEIAQNFLRFVEKVHAALPKTEIVYASILKAPQKKDRWDWVERANTLVKTICTQDTSLTFVDLNPAVINPDGSPRMELYKPDMLHYLPPAYVGFTAILKPILEAKWAAAMSGK